VTKMAETSVEIEEDGLENLTDSTGCTIPKAWARVHDIKVTAKSFGSSQRVLVAFRQSRDGKREYRCRKECFTL
jgi:hypothetical protein